MNPTPTPWKLGAWSGQCQIDHGTTYHPGIKGGCLYTYKFLASEDWESCISAGDAASHIELIGYDESGPILSRANAAFIVQACNAHHALVEALTYLLNETEDYIKINHLSALHNHSLEMARQALALAQKEQP